VLVDGLDFSDDKMLQGRTFSYSDTQRYRVGSNYLQLPINAPRTHVANNQQGGQMALRHDRAPGQSPHVNYEPSTLGGLKEAPRVGPDQSPQYNARLVRQKIDRPNNFGQAGERYRMLEDWERDDLITNLVNTLKPADKRIQDKMVELFTQCDPDYGRRVAEGLKAGSNGQHNGQPIGAVNANDAVQQAEDVSHDPTVLRGFDEI
jgi:catalase